MQTHVATLHPYCFDGRRRENARFRLIIDSMFKKYPPRTSIYHAKENDLLFLRKPYYQDYVFPRFHLFRVFKSPDDPEKLCIHTVNSTIHHRDLYSLDPSYYFLVRKHDKKLIEFLENHLQNPFLLSFLFKSVVPANIPSSSL